MLLGKCLLNFHVDYTADGWRGDMCTDDRPAVNRHTEVSLFSCSPPPLPQQTR